MKRARRYFRLMVEYDPAWEHIAICIEDAMVYVGPPKGDAIREAIWPCLRSIIKELRGDPDIQNVVARGVEDALSKAGVHDDG